MVLADGLFVNPANGESSFSVAQNDTLRYGGYGLTLF